jgi:tetratricopeptide (TPR) repeat protein
MINHATAAQRARVDTLEEKVRDGAASAGDRFELALLAIEPMHDGFRAAALLEPMVVDNDMAGVWLAHCWIYEFMEDASLQKAVALCDEIDRRSEDLDARAAALMLKGAALNALHDFQGATLPLEQSVWLQPAWISNRKLLAAIYERRGMFREAREQLEAALRTTVGVDSRADERGLFDVLITGRGGQGTANRISNWLAHNE